GFLGAGKTTSVARLAQHLTDRGLKVGLITNDQGRELVDTALLRSRGFATEEIPGGCFCCRFQSLVEAAQRLTETTRPDIFMAEPVGSCTDLIATVSYPLRRIYGEQFSIAPLSVLVDPVRALRVFGLETGGKFSDKVLYIYRKQLEEADLIVINKTDLLDPQRLSELQRLLRTEFQQAEVLSVSARTAAGLAEWFERILDTEQSSRMAMPIDYEVYADGESLLGWLNATIHISGPAEFDANELLRNVAIEIQQRLQMERAEIAHLKMTFSPQDAGLNEIAAVNLVRSDFIPELSQTLEESVRTGQLIVNLRAEAAPAILNAALRDAMASVSQNDDGIAARIEHIEHFRPGKPQPTHRLTSVL
ncbi:MAG: cobalamin biosynthesis protein P47K, partial [Verrucomicrobiales bacterium]|nr:cobalamin biosynthesis protein P47K [Verrucomicrobiales bacterium]